MWLPITVAVFFFARWLSRKVNNPICNPLLVSLVILIPLLLWLDVPFKHYFAQNQLINDLLAPSVVALAYPLYEQLPQIRENWRIIMLACGVG
ncbi:LrgB family protein, partial [Vibrio sp.]|uniref:LrgB family protein n=1 Tax=Vibrio sp. TaxID=678 RepID=UPI003D13FB09